MIDIKIKNFVKKLNIQQKIVLALALLIFVRVGSLIRMPFINADYMKAILAGNNLGVLSILTGNSLSEMGIFALSISPYISASIIIQLLTVVFPSLEEIAKDGKTGQDKYKRIIRYTGIGLGFIQALAMAIGFGKQGLITPFSALTVIGATATWTIGATILIGIGEFIELFGIGSGVSMILFLNVISTIPNDMKAIFDMYISGKNVATAAVSVAITCAIVFAVLFACTWLTNTEKRVTLTTSKRMSNYNVQKNTTTMPIPFITCSVMPVIFASSIMSIPVIISRFIPKLQGGVIGEIISAFSQGNWFDIDKPLRTIGAVLYVLLTFFFTYFYLSIQYNSTEIANNLKKTGSIIPGIRPGRPTAEYLEKITNKIAVAGNACLLAVILTTTFITNIFGFTNFALGGTSAIIAISVIHDVGNKLSTELQSRRIYNRRSARLFTTSERKEKIRA